MFSEIWLKTCLLKIWAGTNLTAHVNLQGPPNAPMFRPKPKFEPTEPSPFFFMCIQIQFLANIYVQTYPYIICNIIYDIIHK